MGDIDFFLVSNANENMYENSLTKFTNKFNSFIVSRPDQRYDFAVISMYMHNDLEYSLQHEKRPQLARVFVSQVDGKRLNDTRTREVCICDLSQLSSRGHFFVKEYDNPEFFELSYRYIDKFDVLILDERDEQLQLKSGPPTVLRCKLRQRMKDQFNLTLSSKPTLRAPNNTAAQFTNIFDSPIEIGNDWKVGVTSITLPTKFLPNEVEEKREMKEYFDSRVYINFQTDVEMDHETYYLIEYLDSLFDPSRKKLSKICEYKQTARDKFTVYLFNIAPQRIGMIVQYIFNKVLNISMEITEDAILMRQIDQQVRSYKYSFSPLLHYFLNSAIYNGEIDESYSTTDARTEFPRIINNNPSATINDLANSWNEREIILKVDNYDRLESGNLLAFYGSQRQVYETWVETVTVEVAAERWFKPTVPGAVLNMQDPEVLAALRYLLAIFNPQSAFNILDLPPDISLTICEDLHITIQLESTSGEELEDEVRRVLGTFNLPTIFTNETVTITGADYNSMSVGFSPSLRLLLNLHRRSEEEGKYYIIPEKEPFIIERYIPTNVISFTRRYYGPKYFFIYCNFVDNVYIGSQRLPLLKVFSNPVTKYDAKYKTIEFKNIEYLDIPVSLLYNLRISIHDVDGEIVQIKDDMYPLHLNLNFKKQQIIKSK